MTAPQHFTSQGQPCHRHYFDVKFVDVEGYRASCRANEALAAELAATQQQLEAVLSSRFGTRTPQAYAVYDKVHGGSRSLIWAEQYHPGGDAERYRVAPLYEAVPEAAGGDLFGLACELYGAAQRAPGEGIEQAAGRIEARLRQEFLRGPAPAPEPPKVGYGRRPEPGTPADVAYRAEFAAFPDNQHVNLGTAGDAWGRPVYADMAIEVFYQGWLMGRCTTPPVSAIPHECPHMIVFDDAEREPLLFSGTGARDAALRTWQQVSRQWNAHLFVRVEHNSRDDPNPSAGSAVVGRAVPVCPPVDVEAERRRFEAFAEPYPWFAGRWDAELKMYGDATTDTVWVAWWAAAQPR